MATQSSTTVPRAQWHAIVADDEVGRDLFSRTVAGEHLVVYRTTAGDPVAMADRCSHRNYPPSAGAEVGDEIQCAYHGLRFDACGRCFKIDTGGLAARRVVASLLER